MHMHAAVDLVSVNDTSTSQSLLSPGPKVPSRLHDAGKSLVVLTSLEM